jgi:hypothetical protein
MTRAIRSIGGTFIDDFALLKEQQAIAQSLGLIHIVSSQENAAAIRSSGASTKPPKVPGGRRGPGRWWVRLGK